MEFSKNRCNFAKCNKKIGLNGYTCKCTHIFCDKHRFPEYHGCTYDFKKDGISKLEKDNVKIVAEKIIKL